MFKVVSKSKRLLMWTFLCVMMLQMAYIGLTCGIDLIQTEIFPERSQADIQTVVALPNLLAVAVSILGAALIEKGIAKKKTMVVFGVSLIAMPGIAALLFHSSFWQLIMFSVLIGLGMGLFAPSAQSVMMDNFDERERQLISGFQISFINIGGILMSILGGIMITVVWYGGYTVLLLSVPLALMAFFVLPKEEKVLQVVSGSQNKPVRTKLPGGVYYYSAAIFFFMLHYFVTTSNLSIYIKSLSLGNSAVTGAATALMMIGGVLTGLVFNKLSGRFKDGLLSAAFALLFVGYTLLNLLHGSLPVMLVAVFINGTALSLLIPQCIFSVSNLVDPTNSALANMYIVSIAPCLGAFLSPVVFTNLTQALGGPSTLFRYQFVGISALAFGVLFTVTTVIKRKGTPAGAPSSSAPEHSR